MKETFLQSMKEKLIAEKRSILISSGQYNEDIDMDGDETDEIQGNMLLEMNAHLNIRNNAKLAKIDEALSKIDTKKYGLCEDCDDEIPEKRLLANPYFQTCVSCAEDREIEEKQRKRL